MRTLGQLLVILGKTQQLSAGYLTPVGTPSPNALETAIALRNQFDPFTLASNPQPNMTSWSTGPNILLGPARLERTGTLGQTAIYLEDRMGRIDTSHTPQPAYFLA
jgi:hypothetical protein